MPELTFIEADGTRHVVDARVGDTIMQTARAHGIEAIVAECAGSCACATCHCYVDPAWFDRLTAPDEIERELIECVAEPGETSRLSCQITMREDLHGIVVHLPESQY